MEAVFGASLSFFSDGLTPFSLFTHVSLVPLGLEITIVCPALA
jgi:hypothetical protein